MATELSPGSPVSIAAIVGSVGSPFSAKCFSPSHRQQAYPSRRAPRSGPNRSGRAPLDRRRKRLTKREREVITPSGGPKAFGYRNYNGPKYRPLGLVGLRVRGPVV